MTTTRARANARARRRLRLLLLPGAVLSACDSPTDVSRSGPPRSIEVVRGSGQEVRAGGVLPENVTVEVRDSAGRPVAGVYIDWKLVREADGGERVRAGEILAREVLTDVRGQATAGPILVDTIARTHILTADAGSHVDPATNTEIHLIASVEILVSPPSSGVRLKD